MNDELKIKNNELGGKMNYRYRNDEEMKDSGVEWIGKIPKEWINNKISREFEIIGSGSTPLSSNLEYYNGDINWLLTGDLTDGYIYQTSKKITQKALKDYSTLNIYPEESLIIAMYGATIGKTGLTKIKTTTNQACCVLANPKNLNIKFAHYWFIANKNEIVNLGRGGGQPNISQDLIKSLKFSKPLKSEQDNIVKFLDEKTAEFDSIISKKEALIEKLEEAKKSLISEVVTGKGKVVKSNDGYELVKRKKEEMKDSGVEWLEDIPNEWNLKRSNYVFKFSKGLSITKENLQDEGIPCINYGEIHSKYGFEVNPKRHKLKCVTEGYFNSSPNALIKYGDFVFADTSEDIQGCGNFSYLNAEDSIFAGYHTIIARPIKKVSSRYLAYLFDSDDWRIQIRTKVSGIKVFSITQSILKTTKVILPTLSEQKLIVDYLDNKFVSINSIINNMKKQIEKLKEAKQSLISEAVTGKIEILD